MCPGSLHRTCIATRPATVLGRTEEGRGREMKQLAGVLSLFLLLLSQQHQLADAGWGGGFVGVRGQHFILNGNPFFAHGFNAYWLMSLASDPSQRFKVSTAFQEASSRGLTLARTWAFSDGGYNALQTYPGVYNENMFQGLDFVVSEARRYQIKLILSFVNNYDSFGGKKQYVSWARGQGQSISSDDGFFSNPVVRGYYKNHVKAVITRFNRYTGIRYRDDPTILAWELMNEPRCTSDPSGRTLQGWITEMAAYVKSLDSNHLLEAGLEGFYGQSAPQWKKVIPGFDVGTDFIANNRIWGIDFATVHSYPDQWLSRADDRTQLAFLNRWLDTHIQDARNILQKPLLLTEFGKSWKDPGFNPGQRDAVFGTVFAKAYWSARNGGPAAGALFWQLLTEGMDSYRDGYEIILREIPQTTSNMITRQCRILRYLGKLYTRQRNVEKLKKAKAMRRSQRLSGNKG